MKLDLTDEQFRAVMTNALVRAFPEERRDELVKAAVEQMFTKDNRHWSFDMQQTFVRAVQSMAIELVKEQLADPEWGERLRDLVQRAMEQVLKYKAERVEALLADALVKALCTDKLHL